MGKVIFPGEGTSKSTNNSSYSSNSSSGGDEGMEACGCMILAMVLFGIGVTIYGWVQYNKGYLPDGYYVGLWILTIIVGIVALALLGALLSDD